MSLKRIEVLLCCGSGCVSAGALKIKKKMEAEFAKHNLAEEAEIIETGCMGPCDMGPVMMVYPDDVFYKKITVDDVEELVEEHFLKGRPVERLMVKEGLDGKKTLPSKDDVPFFQSQVKVALKDCGYINPESIEEYIAVGGYDALAKAIDNMSPEEAVELVKASGLRGRGGGGFSTGMKWHFVRTAEGEPKYVICNADEGDPGAFMDRSLLEGDPYRVLEGMTIAAYATGATKGFFYIRAEYPLAIRRINAAIEKAREMGLLGEKLFGSDFTFDAEVRTGAGAFVCGEETALIASIEGERGHPVSKPPFPAQQGLWGQPTLVNNVETLGNLPTIFMKGSEWFSGMGIETSKGTKVFALTGDVQNTGLVEVPMGLPLKDLIYDVGGGIIDSKKFKAAQLGGPSGGCLTEQHLDMTIDYDSLRNAGAMVGSGGVIVMDDSNCMVNVAKFFLEFSLEESCGKCSPCRVGLKQMFTLLEKITDGKGEEGDLEKLQELGHTIKQLSLCGLGQTAPNPVLSTIQYFRDEYEAHINDKACNTGVCSELMHYVIDEDACIGCSLCAKKCPVACIDGSKEEKYTIDQIPCIKCGNCMEVCPKDCIDKIPGLCPELAATGQCNA